MIFHSFGWILRLNICEIIFLFKNFYLAILVLNDRKINCSVDSVIFKIFDSVIFKIVALFKLNLFN